ncbi:MAG: hypothetical protein LBU56_04140, partial [Rickettsiales bacterium]|nr:hypothetical protein [Rickettsiales bacterium]
LINIYTNYNLYTATQGVNWKYFLISQYSLGNLDSIFIIFLLTDKTVSFFCLVNFLTFKPRLVVV